MTYIDLTHRFDEYISIYPGGHSPTVQQLTTVEREGYASKRLAFTSHQGTHIDAMSHMTAGGKTLDDIPLAQFAGKAITIDVRKFAGAQIPLEVFANDKQHIESADFILLYTGWSKHWGMPGYEKDFPTMTAEATTFLCNHHIKGIGMDCFSPDPVNSPNYDNHHIAFAKEVLLIENLTNLDQLPVGALIDFQSFPIKIVEADGAPVRAIAILD